MSVTLHLGDCLDILPTLDAASVDSIICDPPYGLSFMGKDWDYGVPGVPFWTACLRVAKPGAMLLAFGGSRTHHRLMCAIEDAGWEIRDCLMWLYGSGFPKSLDISKAIDKEAGAEREVVENHIQSSTNPHSRPGAVMTPVTTGFVNSWEVTAPATDAAKAWQGWGTSLKPSYEPIILAMKPLDGTFADNAVKWNVAGINVDGCRVGIDGDDDIHRKHAKSNRTGQNTCFTGLGEHSYQIPNGRWPANLILDEESARLLDQASGERPTGKPTNGSKPTTTNAYGEYARRSLNGGGDTGGASRFFYVAKAARSERNEGLAGMEEQVICITEGHGRGAINTSKGDGTGLRENKPRANIHPCVKPLSLMRYLCRLTKTPWGGTVLDPFMGSGTTGAAAVMEGRGFVGIEIDPEYFALAEKRIDRASWQPLLLEVT